MKHAINICFLFYSLFAVAQTSSPIYVFSSPAQQVQFRQLTEQLRCLVCQNESLWDSHADLAKDLRNEVYDKLKQGYSNEQIKTYLVARYGQFILFEPTFNASTYLLWIIPFLLLMLGFFIIIMMVFRARRYCLSSSNLKDMDL